VTKATRRARTWTGRLAICGLLIAITIATASCSKAETTTAPPQISGKVKIAKVISGGVACVAQQGGGGLVYRTVTDSANASRVKMVSTWDAKAEINIGKPLFGVDLAASKDGFYVLDRSKKTLKYATFAQHELQAMPTKVGNIEHVWASPSGRLLIERKTITGDARYFFMDNALTSPTEAEWKPEFPVDTAAWVGDDRLLVQLQSDSMTPGWGRVLLLDVASDGAVPSSEQVGEDGQCPSPDPTGRVWARANETNIELFDAKTKKSLGVSPIENAPEAMLLGAPAWVDATHVAFAANTAPDPSIWVLDVSAILPK
jgi:hypothetical protein